MNWSRCSIPNRLRTNRIRSLSSRARSTVFETMTPAIKNSTQEIRADPRVRCSWASNELSIRYHDEEWGVPVHRDGMLFEFLILEGAQAGLSWNTILNKRENYRAAFDH